VGEEVVAEASGVAARISAQNQKLSWKTRIETVESWSVPAYWVEGMIQKWISTDLELHRYAEWAWKLLCEAPLSLLGCLSGSLLYRLNAAKQVALV
jgi:hypothetical protein